MAPVGSQFAFDSLQDLIGIQRHRHATHEFRLPVAATAVATSFGGRFVDHSHLHMHAIQWEDD
jgi:hypothetical protein